MGMGKDLYDHFSSAKQIFEEANQILGYSIAEICFQGPEDKLTRTFYAQPAIFVTSMAALSVLKENFSHIRCGFSAGLSLGEFSALCGAGSLDWKDGLRLVQKRAEAMEKSAQNNPGTMASILGMGESDCLAIAKEAGCELANLNTPEQMVVSGTVETVEKACVLAESRGAKRAIRLKVGGAFHSSLMSEAKEDLGKALSVTPIQVPACLFIPNVTGQAAANPEEIRLLLAKQLTSSVRWIDTMGRAQESGITQYLEIGPGKVLKGLAKKCQPELVVEPVGTSEDFEKLKSLFVKS